MSYLAKSGLLFLVVFLMLSGLLINQVLQLLTKFGGEMYVNR